MTESEKKWGKENGLKKTSMFTFVGGKMRNVYKSKDGKLYYIDCNHWCGTYQEYCYEKVAK